MSESDYRQGEKETEGFFLGIFVFLFQKRRKALKPIRFC